MGAIPRSCVDRAHGALLRFEMPRRVAEFEFAQHHAGLGAVAHAEAVEDRGKMRLHRALLHVEAVGALLVEQALRSEENTSELQSLMRIQYAAFCLKKTITKKITIKER